MNGSCRFARLLLAVALARATGLCSPLDYADLNAPGGGPIDIEIAKGERVSVTSVYWRLDFDLKHGGALSSVVFPNGSGRNLLLEPLRTSVDQWSDVNARHVVFRSSSEEGIRILTFSGRLATQGRKPSPVSFQTTWVISPFFVRADHKLTFPQDLKISSVDIASTVVRPDLDEFGLRPSPIVGTDYWVTASFGKARTAGQELIDQQHTPINMFFFHRGVEGFDVTTASDLAAWEEGLTGRSGVGYYAAKLAGDRGSISISREPIRSSQPVTVAAGSYSFAYYLGLPRIVQRANRRWRHLSFDNHPWPSDEDIRRWAENGVNVARLHNDFAADGNFWHDASWPPYDEKGMAEVRRIIATCHRYKILVVPYFAPTEFHPQAAGYAEHFQGWARTIDSRGTVVHANTDGAEFGAEMCLQTGWFERRKSDVEKAFREFGFDGVYWDGLLPEPCDNKRHNPRWHLVSDEAVSLLAWCRRLIGPNGILIHHVFGPLNAITFENFADLVVNMEEIANSDEMPRVDTVPIMTVLAESLPRAPCPSYREDRALERNRNRIAQLVLLGMFPWAGASGPVYEETLRLFRVFKPYSLEQYRFRSVYLADVKADPDDVRGAVYISQRQSLVIISNTGSQPRKTVAWTVIPETLGFNDPTTRIRVTDTKSGAILEIPVSGLLDGSLRTELEPYEYRLLELQPINSPR